MKQTHKATLNNQPARQPVAYQGHAYTVTITRVAEDDGSHEPLTQKTVRLQDMPGVLSALDQV